MILYNQDICFLYYIGILINVSHEICYTKNIIEPEKEIFYDTFPVFVCFNASSNGRFCFHNFKVNCSLKKCTFDNIINEALVTEGNYKVKKSFLIYQFCDVNTDVYLSNHVTVCSVIESF